MNEENLMYIRKQIEISVCKDYKKSMRGILKKLNSMRNKRIRKQEKFEEMQKRGKCALHEATREIMKKINNVITN